MKELLCRIQDSFHAISPEIVQRYPNRRMDIAYAPDNDSQKLDIWYPNGWDGSPLPVILMLHGGAFQHGDKYEDTLEPICMNEMSQEDTHGAFRIFSTIKRRFIKQSSSSCGDDYCPPKNGVDAVVSILVGTKNQHRVQISPPKCEITMGNCG